jgi:hypothetical protein
MSDDDIMRKYKFILIDETHERDLQTDLTIYMLKSLLLRQKSNVACPFVVLMSATFEPDSFLTYFDVPKVENFIWCRGEAAGFDEIWDWNEGRTVNNYTQAAAIVVEKIIRAADDEPERGDIFIFLPGAPEFRETTKYLNELNKKLASEGSKKGAGIDTANTDTANTDTANTDTASADTASADDTTRTGSGYPACKLTGDDICYCGAGVPRDPIVGTRIFSILPIESTAVKGNTQAMRWISTPLQDQHVQIGSSAYLPARRVILTTNVAETGVTVPSIKYVVDAGFNRGVEYNPTLGVTALLTVPAPQSRIRQRKGRAGRKFRGVFYPLYPQHIYDMLPVNQLPQILTSDITPIILDIVHEQLRAKMAAGDRAPTFRLADIDMVDVPAVDALNASVEKLFAIGFLRFNPGRWPGPTLEDARAIVDPPMPPGNVPTNTIDNTVPVSTIGFTRFGAIAAYISNPQLSPEAIRMIFAAYSWGVDIAEIITIAAYIESDPQKMLPRTVNEKKVQIDWATIYRDAFPHIESQSLRIITVDEFIDGLALICAVKNVVRADDPLNKLRAWCEKVGIEHTACVQFITSRDELIDHFLANGFLLNTKSQKLADVPAENYMEVVTRIKHCINDGWRTNMLVLGSDGKYKSSTGVSVAAPKFLASKHKNVDMRGKIKPKYIITKTIGVKYDRDADIYEATPGLASVMDGFVAMDIDFTI